MKPFFSIVIPFYDDSSVVRDALESVLRQTFTDLEVIVVDDGSTENLQQVIKLYKKDPRLRALRQEHKGLSAARNFGLREARGEYILFLDSDDFLKNTALERLSRHIHEKGGIDVLYFDFYLFKNFNKDALFYLSEIKNPQGDILPALLCDGNYFNTSRVLIKRKLLEGINFIEGHLAEDWDMWIQLSFYQRATFIYLPEKLIYLRMRDKSLSRGAEGRLRTAEANIDLLGRWRNILPKADVANYGFDARIATYRIKKAIALLRASGKKECFSFLLPLRFDQPSFLIIKWLFIVMVWIVPLFVLNEIIDYYYKTKSGQIFIPIHE